LPRLGVKMVVTPHTRVSACIAELRWWLAATSRTRWVRAKLQIRTDYKRVTSKTN
jgi:hypothetical protein